MPICFPGTLSTESYNDLAKDTQFQLFYAPMEAEKELLLRCKAKTVLNTYQGDASEVVKIHGKFRKAGNAYILFIESLQKENGEVIPISDSDGSTVAFKG